MTPIDPFDAAVRMLDDASAFLKRGLASLDCFFYYVSEVPDDYEPTPYQVSQREAAINLFCSVTENFGEIPTQWLEQEESEEASTEPSPPSWTESGSIPSSKLPGIASFEPELESGSSAT